MEFFRKLFGIKTKEEKIQLEKEFNAMKQELKNKVSCLTKPSVQLIKTKNKTNSKLGGKPLVDSIDFVWPKSNGRPMSFLAQFDLNEVSKHLNYEWLGSSGSVLFFYELREMPWGYDPKDKGKWKVIYQSNPSKEFDFPDHFEKDLILNKTYMEMRKVELLPPYEDQSIQKLSLTDEEIDLYFELNEHYEEFDPYRELPAHQIGGFPEPVQGDDMQFEAQQASNGIYMGNEKGYQNTEKKDFESAKNKWQLLFQFDSDDELDVMWGDAGMLYFWVETNKSKSNNFDDAWVILQCC